MTCEQELIQKLDEAAGRFEFQIWDKDTDYAFTGAMRASGFNSGSGAALIIEKVEYSFREQVIQCLAYAYATFPLTGWVRPGAALFVPRETLVDPDTGRFQVDFGTFTAASRGREWPVLLEWDALASGAYLDPKASKLTPAALLFKLCDSLPAEWLFNTPDYLIQLFQLPADSRLVFALQEWKHPGYEIYEEAARPSAYPDLVALVAAACSGAAEPQLGGAPNTSWRHHWLR